MLRSVFFVLLLFSGYMNGEGSSVGCPAPRSPLNGFVFLSGKLVKFSCRSGYRLIGHSRAECRDNRWNHPVPECRSSVFTSVNRSSVVDNGRVSLSKPSNYFEWNAHRNSLGRQEWRRQQLAEARRRPETLYARSRAASSFHQPSMTLINLPPSLPPPQSPSEMSEMRLRHIEEVHRSRMGSTKSALVDEARRLQYEHAQRPTTYVRRPTFSGEKAAQVEIIYRNTLIAPPPGKKTLTPPPSTLWPPRRPVVQPWPLTTTTTTTAAPPAGEKAAQTQETLLEQYLRAEHLRRIMELERRASSSVSESSTTREQHPDISNRVQKLLRLLPGVDRPFVQRLSPDLQWRYLQEVLTSRGKEAANERAAQEFIRRYHHVDVQEDQQSGSLNFDLSCLQWRSGQPVFVSTPKIPKGYVHSYNRKRNDQYPFNYFLEARYRCRGQLQTEGVLRCRRMEWVGQEPLCST